MEQFQIQALNQLLVETHTREANLMVELFRLQGQITAMKAAEQPQPLHPTPTETAASGD